MVILTLAESDRRALFIDSESCASPLVAETPIMQSPLGLRCRSVVTSMVLPCVARTIACPEKATSSETGVWPFCASLGLTLASCSSFGSL